MGETWCTLSNDGEFGETATRKRGELLCAVVGEGYSLSRLCASVDGESGAPLRETGLVGGRDTTNGSGTKDDRANSAVGGRARCQCAPETLLLPAVLPVSLIQAFSYVRRLRRRQIQYASNPAAKTTRSTTTAVVPAMTAVLIELFDWFPVTAVVGVEKSADEGEGPMEELAVDGRADEGGADDEEGPIDDLTVDGTDVEGEADDGEGPIEEVTLVEGEADDEEAVVVGPDSLVSSRLPWNVV